MQEYKIPALSVNELDIPQALKNIILRQHKIKSYKKKKLKTIP